MRWCFANPKDFLKRFEKFGGDPYLLQILLLLCPFPCFTFFLFPHKGMQPAPPATWIFQAPVATPRRMGASEGERERERGKDPREREKGGQVEMEWLLEGAGRERERKREGGIPRPHHVA